MIDSSFYKNLIYSIRNFLYMNNQNYTWIFGGTEPLNLDTFIYAEPSMNMEQNLYKWSNYISINVYAKENVEDISASIIDCLEDMYIPIIDFLNDDETIIDYIEIERVVESLVGVLDTGHTVRNISIYWKYYKM